MYFFINRTDFGRALEATREDSGAVALVGIDKNRVFALGWGLGAALVGLAGAIMAMFFYIYPDVGASFALIAYVTVALGGFGSVFGAFAGGIIVGLVEASTALILPPSLKSVGIYAVYLLVVFIRPRGLFGSIVMERLRPAPPPRSDRRRRARRIAALVPLFVNDVYVQNIMVLTLMYAALSQSWNILSGYCGQISLGHALYFGLGAYTTALLFTKFGVRRGSA